MQENDSRLLRLQLENQKLIHKTPNNTNKGANNAYGNNSDTTFPPLR